jgi:NAD-dependent deacetylase
VIPLETVPQDIARSQRVLALTGAGISTDSGIPDFRGPSGVWTRDPTAERRATIGAWITDPELRRQAWQRRLEQPEHTARPNAGHRALVELERRGQLRLLVTQNIDGLHLDAGHHPDLVVEIHGTARDAVCLTCGDRQPMAAVLARVAAGDHDPACLAPGRDPDEGPCRGIVKSATISFGQSLVPEDLARAEAAARDCDLLLAVGTTLAVHPAAGLVPLARSRGATVIIVNGSPTEMDDLADAVIRGPISELLPRLVGAEGA